MADVRISELPAASSAAGTDELPGNQAGTTRKLTVDQVAGYARRSAINSQAGTAYTLVLADAGKVVRANNAAAITVTLPTNASVAFAIGDSIAFRQVGAGAVTISPAVGVTLNIPTGYLAATGRQHATIMIHKVAADEWDITGDLAAV